MAIIGGCQDRRIPTRTTMNRVIRMITVMIAVTIRMPITSIAGIHMPAMPTAVMPIIPHPTATAGCSLQPSS